MKSKWMSVGFCALIFCCAASSANAAPTNRTIAYTIYNDPENPELGIRYLIELDLAYADSDGDQIGWEIERVTIARMNSNGTLDQEWVDLLPDVPTTDGLWWTTHFDAESPSTKEFTAPPLVAGFASNLAAGNAAMEYSLHGTVCTGNCRTEALEVPAIMAVRLQALDEEEPEMDEEEEPANAENDI